MPNMQTDWEQLARYLAGEGSEEDRQYVEKGIEDDVEQRELIRDLQHIWEAAEEPREHLLDSLDTEVDLKVLHEHMSAQKERTKATDRVPQRRRSSRSRLSGWHRRPVGQFLSIAFLLVFILGGVAAALQLTSVAEPESSEPTFREIATERAQRATVNLTDGTRVILGADSRLQVPDDFGEQTREVHLDGEAYFEVEEAADRPFVAHTHHAEVVVTGTTFGVTSYQEAEEVQVVVKEGSVAMRSQGQPERHAVAVQAGQMGHVKGQLDEVVLRYVDAEAYLSWTEGRLVFRDMRLSEVVQRLERWYDVDIELEDQSLHEKTITAELKTRSVPDMVHVIATTLGIQYRLDEDKILLMP